MLPDRLIDALLSLRADLFLVVVVVVVVVVAYLP